MIIGTAITKGYQKVISEKFYDCWGNLQVTNFLRDESHILNDDKITLDMKLFKNFEAIPEVESVHTYNVQSAILKTQDDMNGVLIKGVDNEHIKLFSSKYIIDGRKIHFSSEKKQEEIVISKTIAEQLQLKVEDPIILYFLNSNESTPKARKVKIVGIYSTGLEDYDKHFIIADKSFLNKLNGDSTDIIQGYEIYLKDSRLGSKVSSLIHEKYIDAPLQVYSIEQRFPNIFSWLSMMKMNERIIIILMIIIATINMITAFLILVLERVQMIGILKSLGMSYSKIRSIFLYSSFYIISLGVLLGCIVGLSICFLQSYFGIISLDESIYFIKKVPIFIHIPTLIGIVLGTIGVCLSLLIIPSVIIHKISPTKAIRFN